MQGRRVAEVLFWVVTIAAAGRAQTHRHPGHAAADGQYNPFVAGDGRGGFYLAYVEASAGARDVMLRHSPDGRTFSEPVRVNDRPGDAAVRNENPPKVALGSGGEVYVTWGNETGRWLGNVRFARSTDGGRTFAPALTLNSDAVSAPAAHAFQSIAVDRRGRLHVAWIDERRKKPGDRGAEIWIADSTDRGASFSTDRRVAGDVCECCRTALQADDAGTIYLTYRTVPAQGAMLRDVVVARSEDGGARFVPRLVSRDGWEVPGCPVAGPALAVSPSGGVSVLWFVGGGERPGLYWARSTDGGVSFTPRRRLDVDQRLAKHAHLAALGGEALLAGWDDSAGGAVSRWGILDPRSGAVSELTAHPGLSYPVVALSGQRALLAAMHGATRSIRLELRELDRGRASR